jgi:hypothetical protein
MLKNGNVLLYVVQIIITISFTLLAVWLFFNIRYENRGKKWFPLILNGAAWSPLTKSMELLGQINE